MQMLREEDECPSRMESEQARPSGSRRSLYADATRLPLLLPEAYALHPSMARLSCSGAELSIPSTVYSQHHPSFLHSHHIQTTSRPPSPRALRGLHSLSLHTVSRVPTHLPAKMGKRSNASKFPVARIKKIMQADEDVGKVAQATPVVICESLA